MSDTKKPLLFEEPPIVNNRKHSRHGGKVYDIHLDDLVPHPGEWVRAYETSYDGSSRNFSIPERTAKYPDYDFKVVRNRDENWTRLYVRFMPASYRETKGLKEQDVPPPDV